MRPPRGCTDSKHAGYPLPGSQTRCIICASRDELVMAIGYATGTQYRLRDTIGELQKRIEKLERATPVP